MNKGFVISLKVSASVKKVGKKLINTRFATAGALLLRAVSCHVDYTASVMARKLIQMRVTLVASVVAIRHMGAMIAQLDNAYLAKMEAHVMKMTGHVIVNLGGKGRYVMR